MQSQSNSDASAPRSSATAQGDARDGRPRGCTGLKVRQLSRRVCQHFDRIVGDAGLKTTQFSLLSMVVQNGPLRPGEIAARLQMDASTLTRNLQPLIAQGWVVLGPGDDGRTRIVTATEAGRQKQLEARHAWKRAQAAFNERMGIDRVARLHDLIDECIAAMDASGDGFEAD